MEDDAIRNCTWGQQRSLFHSSWCNAQPVNRSSKSSFCQTTLRKQRLDLWPARKYLQDLLFTIITNTSARGRRCENDVDPSRRVRTSKTMWNKKTLWIISVASVGNCVLLLSSLSDLRHETPPYCTDSSLTHFSIISVQVQFGHFWKTSTSAHHVVIWVCNDRWTLNMDSECFFCTKKLKALSPDVPFRSCTNFSVQHDGISFVLI